jgi:membrane protease YdiL (CAAX protease family)
MKKRNNYLWYLAITFVLSYVFQFIIFKTGGVQSPLFTFLMWIPGVIAIVFILFNRESFARLGWGLLKWRYIFPAIFVPLLISGSIVVLLKGLNLATSAGKIFSLKNGMVEISNINLILGNQDQNIPFFILNFLVSHIIFLAIGSLITLGEELGWRGYVQEKIIRKFGISKGLIFLGLAWGYWHLPVVLMGFNFPNHPILGAIILMPLGTVSIGIFMAWLYLRSGSIWIPALAHASANLFSQLIFSFIIMYQDEILRQLLWIAAWGIVAIPCIINLNRNKPLLWQEGN